MPAKNGESEDQKRRMIPVLVEKEGERESKRANDSPIRVKRRGTGIKKGE
jgi:hypothetical protein